MTEPGPFTPPSGPLTPRPPGTPPHASAPLPPPTGAPRETPPHPAPPRRARRRWLLPVIVGGSLAVVGLVVGVAILAVQLAGWARDLPLAGGTLSEETQEELLLGDPGSPIAVDPLDCTRCFTLPDARTLGLPEERYEDVGLTESDGGSFYLTAGEDQAQQTHWWDDSGGTPDNCYFAYSKGPLFFTPGESGEATEFHDPVYYPVWHFDESMFNSFTEGVRVFDDSAAAVGHLAALESAIAGCPDYSMPEFGWAAALTAAPALDLPDSVAAYGWVESGGIHRFYAVDLQRGNLVARLTLASDPSGPSEAEFRSLVEAYAVVLAGLDPDV